MGLLQDQMIDFMKTRGYSEKTIKAYTHCVKKFAYFYNRSPLTITTSEVEKFILYLRNNNKSEATIHMHYEAIKFFYKIHGILDRVPKMRFSRKFSKLPAVLSRYETSFLLGHCTNLKFKTIFFLIYSAGLRISEATNLTLKDIDFSRKTVFVRCGKNNKDRYTILGEKMVHLLKDYLATYCPTNYLFYSSTRDTKISTDCIQRRFREMVATCGFIKKVHVHTLRHCFATHLLENGTSIVHIMKLLGHAQIHTTMIYLHLQSIESLNVKSPMDTLPSVLNQFRTTQLEMFQESA